MADAVAAFAGAARTRIGEATTLGDAYTADVLNAIVRSAGRSLCKLEAHRETA